VLHFVCELRESRNAPVIVSWLKQPIWILAFARKAGGVLQARPPAGFHA